MRVPLSTKERKSFIAVWQAIWLVTPVNWHLNGAMMVWCRLSPKRNSSNTTGKHWQQSFLPEIACSLIQGKPSLWQRNTLMTLTMVNFKKMDEKDFVFINRPTDKKEDEAFSEFLKNRKTKAKTRAKSKPRQKVS